jgi:hypothetical protein
MQTSWDKLVVSVLSSHELLEQLRGFVVELLQLWLESSRFEDCNGSLVRSEMGFFCSAGHSWFNVDEVRVALAQHKRPLIGCRWCVVLRTGQLGRCRFVRLLLGSRQRVARS